MKRKAIALICVLAIGMVSETSVFAAETDPGAIAVDAVVVRPACFLATLVGGVLFVVSLPFATTSRSVHRAARALVKRPAEATFCRPLGDLQALQN